MIDNKLFLEGWKRVNNTGLQLGLGSEHNTAVNNGNVLERDANGCKIRLSFSEQRNDWIERLVLDNLMRVFEKRLSGLSCV